jgi:hypothetical protein
MKVLFRAISAVLLGWFVFVIGAMIFAALRRQELPAPDPKADEVDLAATFGPLEFHSESEAFRGGNVTTWFGGGEVDLSEAKLAPDGATLHVNALFGGGNLIVPDSWNVETRLVGIGGAGDGRPRTERPDDAPTLRIEGTAIFGGWGITSGGSGNGHEELVTA